MGQEEKNAQDILEFFEDNEIENKECDFKKPYAFISYSHDEHDKKIVFEVFNKLYDKGFNLWIDVANIDYDAGAWDESADVAIKNKKYFKFAIFFRSETSLVSQNILDELLAIEQLYKKQNIVVIDIWKTEGMNSIKVQTDIDNGNSSTVKKMNKIIDSECNAIQFSKACSNNYEKLIKKIEKILVKRGCEPTNILPPLSSENVLLNEGMKHSHHELVLPQNTVNDFSVDKTLNATDVKYKICTFGKGLDIGQDILVDVVFNGKRYEAKSHSTSPGRIDRLSGFYKDNHFEEGDRIKATYSAEENTIYIERLSKVEEEEDTIGDFFAGGYFDERLFYDSILDFENKKEPIRHNKLDDMKIYDLEEMMGHEVLRDYVNRRIEDYFDVNRDGFEDMHVIPRHVIEEFGKETIISEVLEELRANPDVDFVYSKSLKVLKAGIEKETENIKKIETNYKPYSEDGKIWIKKIV